MFRRWIVLGLVVVAYAVLFHYFTAYTEETPSNRLFLLAPLLLAGLVLAWRSRWRVPSLALCALVVLVVWWLRDRVVSGESVFYVYLAEHVTVYGLLGLVFGRSLLPAREPLCTRFAREVHGELPPEVERYTRRVTLMWSLLFAAIVGGSLGLFLLAPFSVWSIFANLLSPALVVVMFGVEYRVRLRILPDFDHSPILAGLRAFQGSMEGSRAAALAGSLRTPVVAPGSDHETGSVANP
ncbi:MAG TPA: hypothetical protein VNL74_02480 [Methylococcus sp.]|nr:hypothetical protein [Methylococcus sp.]